MIDIRGSLLRSAVLVVALGSLSLAIGCKDDTSCTALPCAPSELRFVKDAWATGEYELDVSYSNEGDVSFRCSLRIPTAGGNNDDAGDTPNGPSCTQLTGSTRALDLFLESGEPTLWMHDTPDAVQLELRHADQTLFEDALTLDYTTTFPNGTGAACGRCNTASMNIEIP